MHFVTLSPLRRLSDAIEFRRLRRLLPNAHRAWSTASGKLLPETDAEYLVRLRVLAHERERLPNGGGGRSAASGRRRRPRAAGPIGRIADDLRDALEAAEELAPATIEPTFIEGTIGQARLLLVRLTESQGLQTNASHDGDQTRAQAGAGEGRGATPGPGRLAISVAGN